MEIMSMQGSKKSEKLSSVHHNERLEFLGDAVVEFITTVHLFFLFPELEEGGLATYRSALVQNKHLALLAKVGDFLPLFEFLAWIRPLSVFLNCLIFYCFKKIGLHEFMLYAHGPDLCHESDLRHAMANAFEAMMAAVFLDSNINECDRWVQSIVDYFKIYVYFVGFFRELCSVEKRSCSSAGWICRSIR